MLQRDYNLDLCHLELEEYIELVPSLRVGDLRCVVKDPPGDAEPILATALGPRKQPADHLKKS